MSTLPTDLRRLLEAAIGRARTIAEGGARKALEALAVHEPDPYRHMEEAQRDLRRKLRAQAKQLGDGESLVRRGAYEIKHLVEKLAYDQWHRLLFARFLLENNLLISPEHGVSVSLSDCEELAPSFKLKDAWAVAARFAAKELPEIFRSDDPAGAVELPVEERTPLIQIVTALSVETFTASDSLGWCYQFWQAEQKGKVNASGNKIGADELPAVTQLFTEGYMVDFLLDNTLGAWHAGKVLAASTKLQDRAQTEDELRQGLSLPGCPWKYLRFIKGEDGKWSPAAGTFEGWPETAKELKCLDPCMGSGHFVVAMFERLVALRIAEEEVAAGEAVAAVIRDNLFGLELDHRCTQIGAFNLALSAWRRVGHCALPPMNLACSGLAPNTRQRDWLAIAGDDQKAQRGMEGLYRLFKDAPVLGSLINPRAAEADLFVAAFHELQPLLEKVLTQEAKDDTAHEMAVTARGLSKAAEILAGQFTLVATNVPYLGSGKQEKDIKDYCERFHPDAKADLATCFVERCLSLCGVSGSVALVTPQNWLFLGTFADLRRKLLARTEWPLVARLGAKGFHTPMWDFGVALNVISNQRPSPHFRCCGIDVGAFPTPETKAVALGSMASRFASQKRQLDNPDAMLSFAESSVSTFLTSFAHCYQGTSTSDSLRLTACYWELPVVTDGWEFFQTPPASTGFFAGREFIVRWGELEKGVEGAAIRGADAWSRMGLAFGQMANLPVTLFHGTKFADSAPVLVPFDQINLLPLWEFVASGALTSALREFNQKVSVNNGYITKVPFDLSHWRTVVATKYPNGLPKPFSSDPTQWLFNGKPKDSDYPLQVAVARLLGYRWPRQTGSKFPDCPALAQDGLEEFTDDDGIVCLSAAKGEAPAADRLRDLLARTWGKEWSSAVPEALLRQTGFSGKTLDEWLRNGFFEQHCALFHHRPFIWHVWDGHKNGFSALVNYHLLTHANLEKLTYAYLGDWIRRQQAAVQAEEEGSDARLQAAKELQDKLKLILEGEPPYDLFIRWKPVSAQAIGWHPDLNDGVRMNIRPFAAADILRKRVKIRWEKDRGKEPVRDRKEFPWYWGWDEEQQDFAGVGQEPDGNRWNDCHYTNDFKRAAREARTRR